MQIMYKILYSYRYNKANIFAICSHLLIRNLNQLAFLLLNQQYMDLGSAVFVKKR